ncbi:facilitated trehalose transporter Tret1-like [Agrilus planipennis]|uniref:Facilitated trehalose transporter Tret1-like n=1 Tax=Agrilus planipennis TaxID=224129 RepID=A0A1W4X991_AGRPL|nr:facilitated trehalose transporter Tret1-like [Agrilus planipennis]
MTVNQEKSKQWPQYLATIIGSLSTFGIGLQFGWPSQAIPKILSDEFPGNITKDEASYILLIGPLSYLVAAPLFAFLGDIIGRKKSLLLLAVPQVIAWILIAHARTAVIFYVARLIASASEGGLYAIYPMYIGEISEPKIRGILGSSLSVSILVGQLIMTAYGSYTSLTVSAYIACVFPVLFLVLFVWMPESPYYLLMRERRDDAEKSLRKLRRMENVDSELERLTADVQRQMSEATTIKELFKVESNRKALRIMFWLRHFQQWCGIAPIAFYSQMIFKEGGDFLSPKVSSLIVFLTQTVFTFGTSLVIDKLGRRPLFIVSSIFTSLILYILAVYFLVKGSNYDVSNFTWVPIVGMNLFMAFMSIGIGIAPNLMLSEMFSASIKAKALSICSIYFAICLSITPQVYHLLETHLDICAPFFLFATSTLIGAMYAYVWMPETKGKTLEEIQQHLKGRDRKRKTTVQNVAKNA